MRNNVHYLQLFGVHLHPGTRRDAPLPILNSIVVLKLDIIPLQYFTFLSSHKCSHPTILHFRPSARPFVLGLLTSWVLQLSSPIKKYTVNKVINETT